jgi:hypothetical protein
MMLWWAAMLAWGACEEGFVFEGPPECVEIYWREGVTTLHNACEVPVVVDRSVRPPGVAAGPVASGATVSLRDLSFFTLGVDGRLYRAVARRSICDAAG